MELQRIAVLVDGDNISPVHASRILSEAAKLGRVDIARSYVNGANPSEWLSMAGFQGMHAGLGKNSADILLCIDAMEFALVHGIATFLIATSDGDFSHLAYRLREIGVDVRGLGEAKAPDGFRKACSTFEVLTVKKTVKPAEVIKVSPPLVQPNVCQPSALDQKIKGVIAQYREGPRGIRIAALGSLMKREHQIGKADLPEATWLKHLSNQSNLYEVDQRGPLAMVRNRISGIAAE